MEYIFSSLLEADETRAHTAKEKSKATFIYRYAFLLHTYEFGKLIKLWNEFVWIYDSWRKKKNCIIIHCTRCSACAVRMHYVCLNAFFTSILSNVEFFLYESGELNEAKSSPIAQHWITSFETNNNIVEHSAVQCRVVGFRKYIQPKALKMKSLVEIARKLCVIF